jgi:ectoine hydroxylase-related dioxygenase (phytanoyl-CoA dioxygenase family)
VPPVLEAGSIILYNPKTMHCGGANLSPSEHKVVLDVMFKSGGRETDSGDDTPQRFLDQTSRKGEAVTSYVDAWEEVWRQWKVNNGRPAPSLVEGREL